jgi:hypothetical protein
MKTYTLFLFLLSLSVISCSLSDSSNSQESDRAILDQQKNTTEQLAKSVPCTETSTCKYVAFGSKPCGGPWTYLAYNSEFDEELFLNNVALYNANEEAYNSKWGVASDCSVVVPPTSVDCIDGECTAIFN